MSNDTDRSKLGDETVVGRRDVVRLLAAAPLAVFAITMEDVQRASDGASAALEALATRGQAFAPKFFTAAEWPQVRLLANLVIPRDERSGSATDAGVPEFMDFMMTAYPDMQKGMRDGLAWINTECTRRFGRTFVACTTADQHRILDDIAYPKKAAASMKAGVEFFSRFRNLTASGFWSSKIGVADLQYMGNRALAAWTGCPAPALRKLGVAYKS
ncbi:MAG: gluconate 2-dehydrogenase subunit 3 family protein [Gemmatimonadaceae bacterium]